MKLFKNILICKHSTFGLCLRKAVQSLICICIIGSILACILMYFKKTDDEQTLTHVTSTPYHIKSTPLPLLLKPKDTLGELLSAGWNCSLISVRTKVINTIYRPTSQYEENNSTHQTNATNFLVPNVVHYVWLGTDLNFTFIHYLSFLSVHRYIVPTYIFVYGELGPTGYWWNRTVYDVDNIIHVRCAAKTHAPSGKPFAFKAHASDVLRTEIIFKFGGIYLDSDIIVLKSFDPLRRYRTVMGRETSIGLCNGILISAKGAPFIRMLLEQYDSYTGKNEAWAHRSVSVPNILSKLFPSLIHIEEASLNRPNWQELDLIYEKKVNWTNNYAIHLWVRLQAKKNEKRIPTSVKDIDCDNTTVGEMGRHVYYGSKRLLRFFCPPLLFDDSSIDRILTHILDS